MNCFVHNLNLCVICDANQGACIKSRFLSYTIYAERPDIKSQYSSLLYQLLLDPSDRVCFEAINCVLGKVDNTERYKDAQAFNSLSPYLDAVVLRSFSFRTRDVQNYGLEKKEV